MPTLRSLATIGGSAAMLAGCFDWDLTILISAHPTYAATDLVSDNRLLGVWATDRGDTVVMLERGAGHYVAMRTRVSEEGAVGSDIALDVHHFLLGGEHFFDWVPTETVDGKVITETVDGMVIHVPILVRIVGDTLRLSLLDDDQLRDSTGWGRDSVPRFRTSEFPVVLRGSLEGIQAFLGRYAADTTTHTAWWEWVRRPLGGGPEVPAED